MKLVYDIFSRSSYVRCVPGFIRHTGLVVLSWDGGDGGGGAGAAWPNPCHVLGVEGLSQELG